MTTSFVWPGEKAGLVLAKPLGLVPGLRKYRPIPGHAVAQAALTASRVDGEGVQTYQLEELFKLARGAEGSQPLMYMRTRMTPRFNEAEKQNSLTISPP